MRTAPLWPRVFSPIDLQSVDNRPYEVVGELGGVPISFLPYHLVVEDQLFGASS